MNRWILSVPVIVLLASAVSFAQEQPPLPPPSDGLATEKPLPPEDALRLQPLAGSATTAAMGTAFTYQGQLRKSGAPVGVPAPVTCDFQFGLYDAASGGAQVGVTQTHSISVSNGLFTVPNLNFGSGAFNGEARWLAIAVQCPGDAGHTGLAPRQALTPAPYALALPGLWTQQHGTSPNLIGGYHGNQVTAGVVGATIGGGGSASNPNRVTNNYGTVGGGANNQAGLGATVGGGYSNTVSGSYATVSGGYRNTASGSDATVGGGPLNTASGVAATVGGGAGNTASGVAATVGGGFANLASGDYATISGGERHTASGSRATVGGGYLNTASGLTATIGGGADNTASGAYATIPGGFRAQATRYGQLAYASGMFANPGDAQSSLYVLRNTTSSATPTPLYLDGTSAQITVPAGRTLTFEILVTARNNAADSAGYRCIGVVEGGTSGATLLTTTNCSVLYEDITVWNVTLSASGSNLVIQVVGDSSGNPVRWVAVVRTAEVAW